MRIGHVNLDEQVLVVAEIGNNHEGNFDVAKDLVRKAAECGVNAAKFQTFRTEHYVSAADEARFKRLKSFELSFEQFANLASLTHSLGMLFISTPFDLESATFLGPLVDACKIASGDNNFFPLIQRVCETGKPIIVSSGATSLEQIAKTKRYVEDQWRARGIAQELAILHCVSSYPVPPEQANLAAIPFLIDSVGGTIGYSDHTIGIDACIVAVALGARIIEKHFTLDRHFSDFRDQELSADPGDMKQLVERIRSTERMLGRPQKTVQPCEEPSVGQLRRSIVAASDLPAGHRLRMADLTWIRPAVGLPPGEEHRLVGKVLTRPLRFGEPLGISDVE